MVDHPGSSLIVQPGTDTMSLYTTAVFLHTSSFGIMSVLNYALMHSYPLLLSVAEVGPGSNVTDLRSVTKHAERSCV